MRTAARTRAVLLSCSVVSERGAVGLRQQWALLCVWREACRAKAGGVGNAKAQRSLYSLPRRRCKRSWWSSSGCRRDRLPQKSAALSGRRFSRQSVAPLFLHLSASRGAGVTLHELFLFFSNKGRIPPVAPGISPWIFTPEMDGFAGSLGECVCLSVCLCAEMLTINRCVFCRHGEYRRKCGMCVCVLAYCTLVSAV